MHDYKDEIWISMYNHENYYEISNFGRVRSKKRMKLSTIMQNTGYRQIGGNILKPIKHSTGYLVVNITYDGYRRQELIHVAVLSSFVGPREKGMDCCHNNGVRDDNRLCNLRWDTRAANHADKKLHGTDPRGEKHHMAKLTENDVRYMRRTKKNREDMDRIMAERGVAKTTIDHAWDGKTWGHIQ